jgi:hypothetical protein
MKLHGEAAVKAVEEREGRKLSYAEWRVVMVEGYATEIYPDTKNIPTVGVGQTGEWLHRSFKDAFQHHVERAKQRLPDLDEYPAFLFAEIIQAEYRGDLGYSKKACAHMRLGRWQIAAAEWLDHAEYKRADTSKGIKKRIKAVHYALMLMAMQA